MSSERKRSKKSVSDFWRACRYLAPQRKIIAISVVCAIASSALAVSGLSAMLPIMQVLFNNSSLQAWYDQRLVEHRLEVSLAEEPGVARVSRVLAGGPASLAGLRPGEELHLPAGESWATDESGDSAVVLSALAVPGASEVMVLADDRPVTFTLQPLPKHYELGRSIVRRMPTSPVRAIAAVFAILAILAILANTMRFFQEYLSEKSAILAVEDMRRHLYDHTLHMPMNYFGLQGTSNVTSRLVQDAQTLQQGFRTVLGPSILEPINSLFYLGFAFLLSWKLTLFIVLFAPVMMVVIQKFGRKMRRASDRALRNSAEMLGQLESTLIGIRVVKAAGAERFERRRYVNIMGGLVRNNIKMSRIDAMSAPIIETLTLFVAGAIVLYAAYLVLIVHELKPTIFLLVMACLVGVGQSLRKIGKVNNTLQKSNAAAARIFEILDMPVERPRKLRSAQAARLNGDAAGARLVRLPEMRQEVKFENVTFTYGGGASPAIKGVNLTVRRGESIAIVGRNGSGKTTLLALLPRFYDPDTGRITIDGVDIRNVSLRSLRRQISIVTQDSVIFPGTIHDNIAYGQPRASREQVVAAATQAFAHDFIMEKPAGYDTLLDGLGGNLSGGQKQRLNIARAILRKTPILILDEATSQVDAESEHLIQQAIESLIHDRTTFVIAHRFSTILSADRIVVVDRGEVVGQGRHEELLQTCSTYAQLYERQLFVPAASDQDAGAT